MKYELLIPLHVRCSTCDSTQLIELPLDYIRVCDERWSIKIPEAWEVEWKLGGVADRTFRKCKVRDTDKGRSQEKFLCRPCRLKLGTRAEVMREDDE